MRQVQANVRHVHGAGDYQVTGRGKRATFDSLLRNMGGTLLATVGRQCQRSPQTQNGRPGSLWALLAMTMALMASAACAPPVASAPCLGLAGLSPSQCAAVHALALPASLPASPGNRQADNPNAALFGFDMFFDSRLSGTGTVRCATCHDPEHHFSDGKALAVGIGQVNRNAPNLLNAAWNHWQFWDGRADSLWSQPLYTLETAQEMGTTRLALAHLMQNSYREPYEGVFGPLPQMADWPAAGMPGDPAFDGLPSATQHSVDKVAANVGKALEAYVRRVAAGASPLEQFLQGNPNALTAGQQHGLVVLVQAGCLRCHGGPNLTDDAFHNLGVPAPAGIPADLGRALGLVALSQDPFNGRGAYTDGPEAPASADSAIDASDYLGAFKTPSLRNLAFSAPYGHAGTFATLPEAIAFHVQGGGRGNAGYVGTVDPALTQQELSPRDIDDLTDLLQALVGSYRSDYNSPPNWWNWPDR